MRAWRTLLLSAAMLSGLAQAHSLDGLLDSVASACQASPALVTLLQSLGQREGEPAQVRQPEQVAAPAELREAFAAPDRVAINEDTWLLGVAARGDWHGVEVTALTRTLSLSEPGGEFAIELSGSPLEVQAALGKHLAFQHSKVVVDGVWQARGAQFVDGVNGENSTALVCPLPF